MIPIGDDNSLRKATPVVTYILILINAFFFFIELNSSEEFIKHWAFIPSRFVDNPISQIPTIFTAMFMHAGWMHLIGNMLYLWIFGDNVEDHLGKGKFLFFYLISGVAATLAQTAFDPSVSLPNVGASGAVAGVLGAYMLQFPKSKVQVIVANILTVMPALYVIGFWFLLQFVSGIGSLSAASDQGGVAYMAHIGGFVAGLSMAYVFQMFNKPTVTR